MKYHRLYHLDIPKQEAFDWLTNKRYLPRLFPYWTDFKLHNDPILKKNTAIEASLIAGFRHTDWHMKIVDFKMGEELFLRADKCPLKLWEQYWRLKKAENNNTAWSVDIQLEQKKGLLALSTKEMLRILERNGLFRETRLNKDYSILKKYPFTKPKRIVISGSHGLIGSQLKSFLEGIGHDVFTLVRHQPKDKSEIYWNGKTKSIEAHKLENMDAIIHLAGKNIAKKRWTTKRKAVLTKNRRDYGRLLAETITKLNHPPKVYICASAVGFYTGNTGPNVTEQAPLGKGFSAELVQVIEQEAQKVYDAGIRTVVPRFGAVLSPNGGALPKLTLPTLLGGAGPLGSGSQPFSWISIDDAVYGLYHAIMTESLNGPVNFVAPNKCTQFNFMKSLARILKRPCFLPMPAPIATLLFGQMAEELLLTGSYVVPDKLIDSGYEFMHSTPTDALHWVLGK